MTGRDNFFSEYRKVYSGYYNKVLKHNEKWFIKNDDNLDHAQTGRDYVDQYMHNRGFPKVDHLGIDARIVLEQNNFSKKN